jgi:hypothetical protein
MRIGDRFPLRREGTRTPQKRECPGHRPGITVWTLGNLLQHKRAGRRPRDAATTTARPHHIGSAVRRSAKTGRARQLDANQIQALIQGYTTSTTTPELGARFGRAEPTTEARHPHPRHSWMISILNGPVADGTTEPPRIRPSHTSANAFTSPARSRQRADMPEPTTARHFGKLSEKVTTG